MRQWSFHRADDVALGLTKDGVLVEAKLDGKTMFSRVGLSVNRSQANRDPQPDP